MIDEEFLVVEVTGTDAVQVIEVLDATGSGGTGPSGPPGPAGQAGSQGPPGQDADPVVIQNILDRLAALEAGVPPPPPPATFDGDGGTAFSTATGVADGGDFDDIPVDFLDGGPA